MICLLRLLRVDSIYQRYHVPCRTKFKNCVLKFEKKGCEHSQKSIGVLWHFSPLASVASYVAHDKITQNINTGNCGGKIKL